MANYPTEMGSGGVHRQEQITFLHHQGLIKKISIAGQIKARLQHHQLQAAALKGSTELLTLRLGNALTAEFQSQRRILEIAA